MTNRINFSIVDDEGVKINCYKWIPKGEIKGIVQISHGMLETILRYDDFAKYLNKNGYVVYGHDHRGHGKTAESKEKLGHLDKDDFNWLVEDVHLITDKIKREYKDKKVILLGHSMGSFVSQRYIQLYSKDIHALILSGSNGKPPKVTRFAAWITNIARNVFKVDKRANIINKLTFGSYNRGLEGRTEVDWLCSDSKEVDKYIKDSYCGGVPTVSFFNELFTGLLTINTRGNFDTVRKDLPIYIFAGDKDPVGMRGKGIINLYNKFKEIGIKDVTYKLYKDGRHEMLNEVNKKDVYLDIVSWIESKI
ncbi:putative lysophospholipase [Clostridium bornimense]|uniref:Putative lysophospholipase n=1 Tax=Clostridium bornimense TaxID=1216932 RepID=W6S5W2_9CLOT|nr:alpha/beta hydrolase [Clostridium bornimense]CDM69737.1 putative lysophospholipase [Clostridium bornimense]